MATPLRQVRNAMAVLQRVPRRLPNHLSPARPAGRSKFSYHRSTSRTSSRHSAEAVVVSLTCDAICRGSILKSLANKKIESQVNAQNMPEAQAVRFGVYFQGTLSRFLKTA